MKTNSTLPELIAQSELISDNGILVQFDSQKSALDMDAHALAQFTDNKFCTSKKEVQSSLEELDAMDADQLNNSNYTRTYREIGDKLAQKLNISICNLKETQKDVDKLATRYNFFRSSAITMDPILDAAISNKEDVVHQMRTINWSQLEGIDEFVVKNDVHAKLNKDPNEKLTAQDYSNLLNMLPFANKYNEVKFTEMNLSDEAYDRIYDAIRKNTTLDDDHIAKVLNTICSYNALFSRVANKFCANLLIHEEDIEKALDMVYTWSRAIPVLSSQELLDVSNSTMSNIMQRVNVITNVIDLVTYTCIDYRRNRWSKALLVNGPMINEDNLAEFEEAGGKVNDIAKYHEYYFKDLRLPNEGISNEKLFNGIKSVEAQIDKEIADKKLDVQKKLQDVESNAFKLTATEWVNENQQYMKLMSRDEQLKYISMIASTNKSVEDKFYSLIMNTKFQGTETVHLFNALSKAYAAHVAENQKLDADEAAAIDCKVYAQIISEELLKSGLVK